MFFFYFVSDYRDKFVDVLLILSVSRYSNFIEVHQKWQMFANVVLFVYNNLHICAFSGVMKLFISRKRRDSCIYARFIRPTRLEYK